MKLAIGLPSYRPVDQRVACSWMMLASNLTANGVTWEHICVGQCAWLGNTLNTIIRRFVASDCDRLLILDDDLIFSVEDAFRIIFSEHDVIGGNYPIRQFGAGMVCAKTGTGDIGDYSPCHSIGLGFSCMSRRAIEKIVSQSQPLAHAVVGGTDAGAIQHAVFHPELRDGLKWDEDIVFYARLRAAGFTPYVDNRIKLGHIGTHVYTAEDA